MFEMVPFRRNNNSISKRGDHFNQLFNSFFDDDFFAPMNISNNVFRVDLKENQDAYTIEADLPGMKKDAINIEYDNNYLTISAKRDDTVEDTSGDYVRRERKYGEFKRSFYIDNVNVEKIDAAFKDGVLKVTLPKEDKTIDPKRKIDIH